MYLFMHTLYVYYMQHMHTFIIMEVCKEHRREINMVETTTPQLIISEQQQKNHHHRHDNHHKQK